MALTEKQKKLVEENHVLIYDFLHKNKFYPIEEFYDLAAIGLCKAAKGYDESKNFTFSTYAFKAMMSQVLIYFRKMRSKSIIPERLISSGDEEYNTGETTCITLFDTIPSNKNIASEAITNMIVDNFFKQAPENYKKIIFLLSEGYKQTDIGNMFGLSQAEVSRIAKRFRNYILQTSA